MSDFSSKSILKNIFSLSLGRVIAIMLNLVSIMFVARFLGVEKFGSFSYLIALTGVIAKTIEFGFAPIVFRELSKDSNDYAILNSALSIVFVSFGTLLLICNLVLIILDTPYIQIFLINVLLSNIFFSSKIANIRELLSLPFKSRLSMSLPISLVVLDNILFLLLLIPINYLNLEVDFIVIAYVVANIPGFVFLIVLLYRKYKFKFQFNFSKTLFLVKSSLPLYGFIIIMALYQQIDIFFLKYWFGEYEVGLLSVANRFALPLLIIPSAIIDTFLPIIVKNRGINDSANKDIIMLIFKTLYLLSFVIATIFFFKSSSIVSLVWGNEYIDADIAATLLLFAQIFAFYNFIFLNIFVAYSYEKWNFIYALVLLTLNIFAIFTFIPEYSYVGAAIARFIAVFCGTLFYIFVFQKLNKNMFILSFRMIIWSMVLFGLIYILSYFPLFIYLFLSLVLVVIVTLVSRYFNSVEFGYLLKIFPNNKLLLYFVRE